ncbi:PH-interacting protein [Orchesella cincta]|uniref:PH-interacting protein n=1 Tax=Orchesella cincta TaxID=48709 RepID=A0A1D2N1T2_ORCCI|nr:PH-interacting protein [Orchesella cincta]
MYCSQFNHIGPNHLPKLLELCVKAADAKCPTSVSINKSLLSSSTLSLLSRASGPAGKSTECSWSRRHGQVAALRPQKEKRILNPVQSVLDQSVGGTRMNHSLIRPDFYERLQLSCSTLGHLSAVYCVLFDMTGKYIFTVSYKYNMMLVIWYLISVFNVPSSCGMFQFCKGADDNLVKIWSALDGRLLATLRGASSEITDLAVNSENTLLAAGSCDKLIRVWCLRSCAPIAVLNSHSGSVTSLFFCPIPRSRLPLAYLASTSTDGSCAFWGFTEHAETGHVEFQPRPTLYQERMRPGHAQMICSSFSPGGIFMAAGSADNNVRVYNMLGHDGPERILEVEVHTDRVDSISWAHEGLRFVSGSKDGTAMIWRFEKAEWRWYRLLCAQIPRSNVVYQDDPKRRPRVTMVAWNSDDSLVLTAVSDSLIKVWDSKTGEFVRVLDAHQDEAYVIESHPFNPRLVCTAGHDGRVIIWDIGTLDQEQKGRVIFQHHNQLDQGQGHGAVFDCKWAPDGLALAATDSHGHLLIFTTQSKDAAKFSKLPKEMFFHTDYRPLTRDAMTHEVLDEQTQVPPHLMPPPFLVDMEGNPYPPNLQRLVPGREKCREEQLVPNVAIGNGGFQEVIEGLPHNPRSNIDAMIEQLAVQQGVLGENRNAVPVPRLSGGNNQNETERRGLGLRRSGDVEGVRQSTGNWQRGNYGFPERKVIMPLSRGMLAVSEDSRQGLAELEDSFYKEENSKRSASGAHLQISTVDASGREARSRRVRRLALEAAERRRQGGGQPNIIETEGVARPNPRPQVEISVNQQSSRRSIPIVNRGAVPVARRQNARPPRSRFNVRRMFEDRGAQNESDIENMEIPSEEDSSDEVSLTNSSSSSSDDDSESDWGGGGNATKEAENRKRPTAEGSRKSARKSNAASPQSEANAESDDEPTPGPSTAATSSPSKADRNKPRRARNKVDYGSGLEEVPTLYRPSEWLGEVFPKRSPYFPQLGDDLVYYREGHEAYVNKVEKENVYAVPKKLKKILPYLQHPDLEAAVPVRVVNMKFDLEPPRLVGLKLAVTDWESGELTGTNLFVRYHDIPDVVDFLILRQVHDKYIRHNWNPGDRCISMSIDKLWWVGTVSGFVSKEEPFSQSKFMCYNITWDNDGAEKMSPWDMDIITDSFEIPPDAEAVPASDEDLRSGLYEATSTDWPPYGHQDAQCAKISRLIEQVMGLAISEAFLTPVDINRYPEYAISIEYPIDLSTIKARLDNRFYRRVDALRFDVKYIANNAEKFNRPDSDIVKHARIIRDLCLDLISNPDVQDVNPVYHTIVNNYLHKREAEASAKTGTNNNNTKPDDKNVPSTSKSVKPDRPGTSQQPSTSRRSLRNQGKPSKRIEDSEEEEEEDTRGWKDRCRDLLEKIWQCKDAAPFRVPVNPEEYPDYYQAVDTPMDLQSVKEDLLGGNYSSASDFHKDMNLIFHNSRQYNTDKRSQIYSMTIRLQSMYECQVKPILTSHRSRKKGKSVTSSPSKNLKKRVMPTRGSANSSPRKNPVRNAASKNPYLHYENGGTSDEGNDERRYATRGSNIERGSNSRQLRNKNATPASTTRSVNGHSSRNGFSPPIGSKSTRKVKRYRISSGESLQSHPSNGGGRRAKPAAGSSSRRQRAYAEDEGSDEFEDSDDVPMPHLHAAADNSDDDDYDSDQDASRSSLRRSSRVQKLMGSKRRQQLYDSDDYSYGTRYRGRQLTNYDETQNGSSGDEHASRKKRPRQSSRTRESPPRKLRRQDSSPGKKNVEDEDEEEEEEEEDPDKPGPSSRLLRVTPSTRRTRRSHVEEEEEEEENEDEEEDDDDDEEVGEEGSSDGEEEESPESQRRSSRLKRKPSRHSYSDEDANSSPPRSRKRFTESNGVSRRTTRGNRPDYAEDSESEPDVSTLVSNQKSYMDISRECLTFR